MSGLLNKNRFHVYYQKLDSSMAPIGELVELGKFKEISGLTSETEQSEWKTGADLEIVKTPGLTKYGDVTLKKGYDDDNQLLAWRDNIYIDGCGQIMDYRDLYIFILGRNCKVARVAKIKAAWPRKYDADSLDGMSNDPWIESADFAHSGWKFLYTKDADGKITGFDYAGVEIEAAAATFVTTP